MKTLAINSNKYLKNPSDLLLKIAKATVASFKLEGIIISLEEALEMAKESAARLNIGK